MKNIIFNQSEEEITIDVIGQIGEGFFNEGVTLENFKAQLGESEEKNITLNISSLGGDVFEAFAIYDLLKSHKGMVTSNIMGATASAGTVIAMGGDSVTISDNSLFLIHNCSSLIIGGADEAEKQAIMMRKVDGQLNKIYRKKTNQTETFIRNLMNENKWISAKEAKEYGFVNLIKKGTKALSPKILNAINESELPHIKNEITNSINMKQFEILNETIGVENLESTKDGVFLNEDQMSKIEASFSEKDLLLKNTITEKDGLIATINAEKTALDKIIVAKESEMTTLKEENSKVVIAKETEITTLKAEVERLSKLAVVPPIDKTQIKVGDMKFNGKPLSIRSQKFIESKNQ